MALERPQKPAERACCAGYIEVMGRSYSESASVWWGHRGLDWSRPEKEGPQLQVLEEAGEAQVLDAVDGHAIEDDTEANGNGAA